MRIRHLLPALAALIATAMPPTRAAEVDLPKRKPGLWEVSMVLTDRNMPPRITRLCTDASTEAELFQFGMTGATNVCTRKDISRSGDTVTADLACKLGETNLISHSVTVFAGDVAYRVETNVHYDPPMGGRSQSSVVQEAKWLGACPPDMQPGDILGPNGMKMNLRSLGK